MSESGKDNIEQTINPAKIEIIKKPQKVQVKEVRFADGITTEQREELEQLSLIKHIEDNTVRVGESGSLSSNCVDGRNKAEQIGDMVRRAGGDIGLVMGLVALGVNPNKAVKVVFDFRSNQEGGRFGLHSSDHDKNLKLIQAIKQLIFTQPENEEDKVSDCGHHNASAHHKESYGVSYEQAVKVWQETVKLRNQHSNKFDFIYLQGGHEEKGLIVVDDANFTVVPNGGETQFFVYDVIRDRKLVQELARFIKSKYPDLEVDFYKLWKALDIQTKSTLAILDTSRDVPMVTVQYEEDDEGVIATIMSVSRTPSEPVNFNEAFSA